MKKSKPVKTFMGHKNFISDLEPIDDTYLLSSSGDMTIKLWNMKTGEIVRNFPNAHGNYVYSVTSLIEGSQPANKFFSSSADGLVKFWTLKGECLKTYSPEAGRIGSVAIYNNKHIFLSCEDQTIKEINIETGKELKCLVGHTSYVGRLYLHDGLLYSVSGDTTIMIWDPKTCQAVHVFKAHKAAVSCLGFPPNRYMVSGSWDRSASVKLWDLRTNKQIKSFNDAEDAVSSLDTISLRNVYYTSWDGTLYRMDFMN